jgi:hypothetical protein
MEPFYHLRAPKESVNELTELMTYYDFKHKIELDDEKTIRKYDKDSNLKAAYQSVQEFLLNGIFYKTKKNLVYYPITNMCNKVVTFDTSPYDVVKQNPTLYKLFDHVLFRNYLTMVHNYGTFFRFAENKVQRLYWNPALNAGIPLTPKEKDPVYELAFMMHDFGHFILPDLIFIGDSTDDTAKKFYVNWRLLGESITIVINEMLLIDYLKDTPEFMATLKIGYDKPYKLYRILHKDNIKKIFLASYSYFCSANGNGFLNLIDKSIDGWKEVWDEFNSRYKPVSLRGKEWTETNFDNINSVSKDYQKWWSVANSFHNELKLQTIECFYDGSPFEYDEGLTIAHTDENIMDELFSYVWDYKLKPLLTATQRPEFIDANKRSVLAFKRYMVGNLFLLTKYDLDTKEIVERLNKCKSSEDFKPIMNQYKKHVMQLYESKHISMNEYHNYKNIYIMIPPNIISKNGY